MSVSHWLFLGWFLCIAVYATVVLSGDRRRTRTIQTLALRLGFGYLDTTLPQTLSLQGTELEQVKTWNVMEGSRNGMKIAVFDCQSTRGRVTWRCTAIAAQGTSETLSSAARFDLDFRVERSGDWAIMYQKSAGLMPPDDIEAYMTSIGVAT